MHITQLSIRNISSWFYAIDTQELVLCFVLAPQLAELESLARIIEDYRHIDVLTADAVGFLIFNDNAKHVFRFKHGFGENEVARGLYLGPEDSEATFHSRPMRDLPGEFGSHTAEALAKSNAAHINQLVDFFQIDPKSLPCLVALVKGFPKAFVYTLGADNLEKDIKSILGQIREIADKYKTHYETPALRFSAFDEIMQSLNRRDAEIEKRVRNLRSKVRRVLSMADISQMDRSSLARGLSARDVSLAEKRREILPTIRHTPESQRLFHDLNLEKALVDLHGVIAKQEAMLLQAQEMPSLRLYYEEGLEEDTQLVQALYDELEGLSHKMGSERLIPPLGFYEPALELASRVDSIIALIERMMKAAKYFATYFQS